MDSDFELYQTDRCSCNDCQDLWCAYRLADRALSFNYHQDSQTKDVVWDVADALRQSLRDLHLLHRPECYDTESKGEAEDDLHAEEEVDGFWEGGEALQPTSSGDDCDEGRASVDEEDDVNANEEVDGCGEEAGALQRTSTGDNCDEGRASVQDREDFEANWMANVGWTEFRVVCGHHDFLNLVKRPKTTRCECDDCARLKKAATAIDDVTWWEGDECSIAVAKAQKEIWEARKTLHRHHRPELYKRDGEFKDPWFPESDIPDDESYGAVAGPYDEEDLVGNDDCQEEEDETGYGADEYLTDDDYLRHESGVSPFDPNVDHEGKFIVCDHCMSHGLPCNEDSVCYQCQLHDQPCLHRWCPDSPQSRAACQNENCRYAHEDYLPRPNKRLPEYTTYPGNLPRYLSNGRKGRLDWDQEEYSGLKDYFSEVSHRQWAAEAVMEAWVVEGLGTLEKTRMPCGKKCGGSGWW